MRVVGYCRFSSEGQRDGYSIEAQKRAIEEYCEREQYTLLDWYVDEARSGTSDNREAFQSMIADSGSKRFQAVIVHKLDRFARDRYDSAVYKKKLKDHGVRLLSVLEPLDDSPESVMMESVLEGMAEYYSRNLSREVLKGKRIAAKKAQHQGGITPYGLYVQDDMTYGVVAEEAAVIRDIFSKVIAGYSLGAISRHLQSLGIRNRNHNFMTSNFISKLVSNPMYKGQYVYGKRSKKDTWVVVDDAIEAIVDSDIYDRANAIAAERIKKYRSMTKPISRNKGDDYILTGLLQCGICGSHLYGFHSHKSYKSAGGASREYSAKFYRCAKKTTHDGTLDNHAGRCSFKNVKKEDLEDFVFKAIESVIFSDVSLDAIVTKIKARLQERMNKDQDASGIEREIEKLKRHQDRLLDLYLDGALDIPSYNARKAELATTLDFYFDKLKKSLTMAPEVLTVDLIKSMLGQFLNSPQADSLEYKKMLLASFIDSIVIDNENVVIYFKFELPNTQSGELSFVRNSVTVSTCEGLRTKFIIRALYPIDTIWTLQMSDVSISIQM